MGIKIRATGAKLSCSGCEGSLVTCGLSVLVAWGHPENHSSQDSEGAGHIDWGGKWKTGYPEVGTAPTHSP